jgi:hypothetical protein
VVNPDTTVYFDEAILGTNRENGYYQSAKLNEKANSKANSKIWRSRLVPPNNNEYKLRHHRKKLREELD